MNELSIFIDESGDFGAINNTSPYYLVTLVFHNQNDSINSSIKMLDSSVELSGFNNAFIHAGPLIRREDEYSYMSIDERRTLFYKMRMFFLHAPILHHTIIVNKKHINDIFELNTKISKSISRVIQSNLDYFQNFDKIIVYYDNGQQELNMIINTVLSIQLSHVEFRKATQINYRLLQLADFICTLELLNIMTD